jgi:hypothetical protein
MSHLVDCLLSRFRFYRRWKRGSWFYVSGGKMIPGGPFEYWQKPPLIERGVAKEHVLAEEHYDLDGTLIMEWFQ